MIYWEFGLHLKILQQQNTSVEWMSVYASDFICKHNLGHIKTSSKFGQKLLLESKWRQK